MTSRDFCFWLQGFFEVNGQSDLSPAQVDVIRRHLNLVFKHEIDPSMPDPDGKLQATQARRRASSDVPRAPRSRPIATRSMGPSSSVASAARSGGRVAADAATRHHRRLAPAAKPPVFPVKYRC